MAVPGNYDFALCGDSAGQYGVVVRIGKNYRLDGGGFDDGRQCCISQNQLVRRDTGGRKALGEFLTAQDIFQFRE